MTRSDRDELQIIPVSRSDLQDIHRLEVESFPAPWRLEFFESELAANGRFHRVARIGNDIVAYLFSMWFIDEMHINKIAVSGSRRRQGIAAALMAACLEFAREHGIRTISLEVRQSNEGAQAFYRQLDFVASYVRPRYYPDGEAAVVMTREL